MFMLFRAGRYAVRASGSRGPKGPAKEWPWPGKLLAAAILIWIWCALSWISFVITLGVTVFLVVPCCLAAAHEQRDRRLYQHDPLAKMMEADARRKAAKETTP